MGKRGSFLSLFVGEIGRGKCNRKKYLLLFRQSSPPGSYADTTWSRIGRDCQQVLQVLQDTISEKEKDVRPLLMAYEKGKSTMGKL